MDIKIPENPLYKSWHDSNWIPHLNITNVLDYFCERSNIFYDKQCNNEILRMQQQDLSQLDNMIGIEYIVLHAQDPILYVIRKQERKAPGPNGVIPLCDYYIIAGYVYQAPDLSSIINSRLLTSVHHLQSAFDETLSYMRYHPTKGYSWEFSKDNPNERSKSAKDSSSDSEAKKSKPESVSSSFQRSKVEYLLGDLVKKFPPKAVAPVTDGKTNDVSEVKVEQTKKDEEIKKNEGSQNKKQRTN